MAWTAPLVIDSGRGVEQVLRMPRPTDAVGEALRRTFATRRRLPDEFAALLNRLDGEPRR